MDPYYPVFLNLHGKNVLVIGGGTVAERKIRQLAECGANVSVVAPRALSRIESWSKEGRLSLFKRLFRREDLAGKDLLICASNNGEVNLQASRLAQRRRIWVNAVDRLEACSFIVPAVVKRGDVIFAISTGGASPALARFLRRKIGNIFGNEVALLAKYLKKHREEFLRVPMKKRKLVLKRILNEPFLSSLRRGKGAGLEKKIKAAAAAFLQEKISRGGIKNGDD